MNLLDCDERYNGMLGNDLHAVCHENLVVVVQWNGIELQIAGSWLQNKVYVWDACHQV